jgi:hypothetical protein
MNNEIYRLMIESLDRSLSEDELQLLRQAMANDANLQAEMKKMETLRRLLSERELDFEPFFETRVMAGITGVRDLFSDQLFFVFRRLALASLFLVLVLLAGTWWQYGSLSINAISGLSELNQDNAGSILLYDWEK